MLPALAGLEDDHELAEMHHRLVVHSQIPPHALTIGSTKPVFKLTYLK
jgi:hypothetical protein